MKKPSSTERPFTTDYGMTKGHCASRRGALQAAQRYLIDSGKKHCVIEALGNVTVDVYYNGRWGFSSQVRRQSNVTQLRRVK